eukprot:1839752-Pleurochrysis_carterae.AAC.3
MHSSRSITFLVPCRSSQHFADQRTPMRTDGFSATVRVDGASRSCLRARPWRAGRDRAVRDQALLAQALPREQPDDARAALPLPRHEYRAQVPRAARDVGLRHHAKGRGHRAGEHGGDDQQSRLPRLLHALCPHREARAAAVAPVLAGEERPARPCPSLLGVPTQHLQSAGREMASRRGGGMRAWELGSRLQKLKHSNENDRCQCGFCPSSTHGLSFACARARCARASLRPSRSSA